ncbi:MAG TPA: FHA domain-containing protein [Gemmatales bacterium]|nr:FHA domain-containing protein [Gemmatales bacterium]HMP15913.1 FHA domain-containing protein [Gemmatales bacterium]
MKFSLIVVSSTNAAGKEIPIRVPEFVIGRDPECHLRPASPMISKKHCAFYLQGERVLFKDFGSTNGSFVNDARVEGETYVKDGDVIKFGPLLFKAKMEATAVMAAAPSAPTLHVVENTVADHTASSTVQTSKKSSTAEDDIAAMLFNFADAPSGSIPSSEIPLGSTVAMNMDATKEDQPAMMTDEQRRAEEKKKADAAKKPSTTANTSSAAEAILQKYMRRPR